MIDVPWKIFSQTGNIEAYLWMKEVEIGEDQEFEVDIEENLIEDTHF
ncbi:YqzL family protein [Gracilibacillus boraciitolerans]|nr:YqzL family protein [Gracilibacillus boraciitolerans]